MHYDVNDGVGESAREMNKNIVINETQYTN
jgi:hypothetical protein